MCQGDSSIEQAGEKSGQQRSERYDNAVRILQQHSKRRGNWAVFHRPLSEQYTNGVLQVAAVFKRKFRIEPKDRCIVARQDKCSPFVRSTNFSVNGPIGGPQNKRVSTIDGKRNAGWQQYLVFVCDIKRVQVVEFEFACWEGLDFVQNEFDDIVARPVPFGLSAKGCSDGRFIAAEWKLDVSVPRSSIVLDCNPVSVVEADADIVDGIAYHCGCAAGHRLDEFELPFSVTLGPKRFCVSGNVSAKNGFYLADVLLGPFEF